MAIAPHRIPSEVEKEDSFFVHCENNRLDSPDSEMSKEVLDRFETILAESYLRIFYKYPNVREGGDVKIDIVALSSKVGLLALEVREYKIEEIETIEGPDWKVADSTEKTIRRVRSAKESITTQLRDQDELLTDDFEPELKIPVTGYLALPNIDRDEFESEFDLAESKLDRILFSTDFSEPVNLRNRLPQNNELSDEVLRHSLAVLYLSDRLRGDQLNVVEEPTSKGEISNAIDNRLKCITEKQFQIALELPNDPQRIRGIAGSGKTVVMAFRAAYAHAETDWDICVTFRNHSLYQTYRSLIEGFYGALSGGESPNWEDSISVTHGWGNQERAGLYSLVVENNDAEFIDSDTATKMFNTGDPAEKLDGICRLLLESHDYELEKQFDAVFIDEGQDFPPAFYQMCREILSKEQRLYWAADEAQNLSTLEARDLKTLFNKNPSNELNLKSNVNEGTISGGYQGTHVMRRSFRTPRSVLMTAHAFGMGLYRDEPLRIITEQRQWERLGYRISEGDFKIQNVGDEVRVKRDASNSPHPLTRVNEHDNDEIYPLVKTEWFDNPHEEYRWIVSQIDDDLGSGLNPEDIMIIHLWPPSDRDKKRNYLINAFNSHSEQLDEISSSLNIVSPNQRGDIKKDGQITITQVHYARGNEAPAVYVAGLEYISHSGYKEYTERHSNWYDLYLGARNESFIAISRSLAWCTLTGSGENDEVSDELDRILSDTRGVDPYLSFPNPPEELRDRSHTGLMALQTELDRFE